MGFTNFNYKDPAQFNTLVKALIQRESGGDPNAVSRTGAIGLGQVMPATARDPGFGVAPLSNPLDPAENERFTRQYLAAMLERSGGNLEPALASYNAGPGNGDKFAASGGDWNALPMPGETKPYVQDIMKAIGQGGDDAMTMGTRDLSPETAVAAGIGDPYGGGEEAAPERKGVIQQLMSGNIGGAAKTMFTAPDMENPRVAGEMYSGKSKAIEDASRILDAQMSNTNAPISWSQVLGSGLATGVGAYQEGKAATEADKVQSQLQELMSSGNMDPKTIATINSLDPQLGRSLAMAQLAQKNDLELQAQRAADAQQLQAMKPAGDMEKPTALVKNLVAAGFKPGTPEFQTEVMKQMNKVDPGMQVSVGPDGSMTVSNGGSTTSIPGSAPGGVSVPEQGVGVGGDPSAPAAGAVTGTPPAAGATTNETQQGNVTGVAKPEDGRVQFVDQDGKLQERLIPGSKGAGEAEAARRAKIAEENTQRDKAGTVLNKIEEVRKMLKTDPNANFFQKVWAATSTGLPGQLTEGIGGTPAKQLRSKLDTIAANIGFDALAEMRRNSPTGGALGNVTERELALLQSTIASLDPNAGEEVLKQGLSDVERQYNSILKRLGPEGQAAFLGGATPGAVATPPTPGLMDTKKPTTQEEIDSYPPGTVYELNGKKYRID